MSAKIISRLLSKLALAGALAGCQGAPPAPTHLVRQYVLDIDHDTRNDTVVVHAFLYGPGIRQAVPFDRVSWVGGRGNNTAYYVLHDVYWRRGKQKRLVLSLERESFTEALFTRATDSLTVQPLAGGVGLHLEATSSEIVPDITFLDLSLRPGERRLRTFGRINTTGAHYSAKYWADTCAAQLNYDIEPGERLNTDRLGNSIDPEEWHCQ